MNDSIIIKTSDQDQSIPLLLCSAISAHWIIWSISHIRAQYTIVAPYLKGNASTYSFA